MWRPRPVLSETAPGRPHDHTAGTRSTARRRLTLLALLLVVAIAGADWLIIVIERQASVAAYQTAMVKLTNGMLGQTLPRLDAADKALLALQDALTTAADRSQAELRSKAALELVLDRQHRLTGIDSVTLVDAQGRVATTTRAWAPGTEDVSDQDFFRHFTRTDDPGLFVGAPRQDTATGRSSAVLARRLNGPGGDFAGVVLAELSLTDLEDFYRVAMPPGRTVAIQRRDGTLLVAYPPQPAAVGRKPPDSAPWYAALAAGGGGYLGPGLFDPAPVVAVLRPMGGLPLVIQAAVIQSEVLSGWYQVRVYIILGGIVAAGLAVGLVRLFAVQLDRLAIRNAQLDDARHQLDAAMSNIPQGLCFFDGARRLIVANRRFGEIYGLPPAATRPGISQNEIVDYWFAVGGPAHVSRADYLSARAAIARSGQPHESMIELVDGRTIAIQQQPMPDGGWVATHEDITERRRAESQISFLARHDALTGLPNRSLLLERIDQARLSAGRGGSFALLFLDLDRFKAVNDTLGHAAGDELLRAVTARLLATVREGDTVARLGGDEFVVLQSVVQLPDSPAMLAERIIRTIAAPYMLGSNEVLIGVSVGIDVSSSAAVSADDLLKNADLALYTAKNAGRGSYRFFEPEMDAKVRHRAALERDLQCAVERGEFEVYYQPIVHAESGQACGFESLVRWNHPSRGLVGPGEFIEVAEDCGLIIPLGEWVLRQACRDAARWPEAVHVSVNLSPVQFRSANLVDMVRDALDTAGLPPARLELEITETVLLESNERNIAVMHQLRALGIGIVMDDFGIGYSSLSYLRRFPFDRIKIDQSFVRELTTRRESVSVVRAVVGLCRDLGIRTTAEGVETAEQLSILLAERCTELQGYLFGRPSPVSRLSTLINGAQLIAPGVREAAAGASVEVLAQFQI